MKIVYLINKSSYSSIPVLWADYLNVKKTAQVRIITFKSLFNISNCFFLLNSNLIHGHHIKIMALFCLISKKKIFTVHSSFIFLSNLNKFFLKFIFKRSDKIIFVNQPLFDVLPTEYKEIIELKYSVILNGVNLNENKSNIDIFSKYNLDKNLRIIFHPARFIKLKNHKKIIEAFFLLKEKVPNVYLVLAGEGKMEKEIHSLVAEKKMLKNVMFLGSVSREVVFSFLTQSELFLMMSFSEGLNMSFLEALSFNTKILVSDLPQFRFPFYKYQIDPRENNVFFTSPFKEKKIANKMEEVLFIKKKENQIGDFFSIDIMIEKYLEQYKLIFYKND